MLQKAKLANSLSIILFHSYLPVFFQRHAGGLGFILYLVRKEHSFRSHVEHRIKRSILGQSFSVYYSRAERISCMLFIRTSVSSNQQSSLFLSKQTQEQNEYKANSCLTLIRSSFQGYLWSQWDSWRNCVSMWNVVFSSDSTEPELLSLSAANMSSSSWAMRRCGVHTPLGSIQHGFKADSPIRS